MPITLRVKGLRVLFYIFLKNLTYELGSSYSECKSSTTEWDSGPDWVKTLPLYPSYSQLVQIKEICYCKGLVWSQKRILKKISCQYHELAFGETWCRFQWKMRSTNHIVWVSLFIDLYHCTQVIPDQQVVRQVRDYRLEIKSLLTWILRLCNHCSMGMEAGQMECMR